MAIKHVYEIVNNISGESLGGYEADDEQGALDALARDAGYADDAAMCREVPRGKHELRVTLQSVVVPDAPKGCGHDGDPARVCSDCGW